MRPLVFRSHRGEGPPKILMTLRPVNPDEMVCVWHSPTSGTYEWIVGPELAADLLNGGMQRINGQKVRVEIVDQPKLGGIHIRATMTEPFAL